MHQGGTSLITHEDPSLSLATSCDHLERKATYRVRKYAVFLNRIKTDLYERIKEYEDLKNFMGLIVNDATTIDREVDFVAIK